MGDLFTLAMCNAYIKIRVREEKVEFINFKKYRHTQLINDFSIWILMGFFNIQLYLKFATTVLFLVLTY